MKNILAFFMTRRVLRDGARYFGPFADAGAVHRVLKLMQTALHLRTCRSMKVERPCLQVPLGHCEAPCVNYISKAAYQKQARLAVDALEGRNRTLYKELQDKMEAALQRSSLKRRLCIGISWQL